MASVRRLDYLLNLIDHPTEENATITCLALSNNDGDRSFANDIEKNNGIKISKLMENLAGFPNLKEINPCSILGELNAYELTRLEEKDKQQMQALVSRLLCIGIASSKSLERITLPNVSPRYFQDLLNSINNSKSIFHLNLFGIFPDQHHLQEADLKRIEYLINFLRRNSTITSINLCFCPASHALKFIEAIVSNPDSKITTIDLSGTRFSKQTAIQINQFCKQKNISVTLKSNEIDYSHIALCDDLATKKSRTLKEAALLFHEKVIKSQLEASVISIQEIVAKGKKVKDDGLTYLITRFTYLIKTVTDLKYVMEQIPEKHRTLVCERFLTDHIAKDTGDVTKWDIPELQAVMSQRKQLQTVLGESIPITPLQSIILSYSSTLFCPRQRIVASDKKDDNNESQLKQTLKAD
ncbi:MAG: hypothetical protein ACYCQI_01685 [Gammaproteobacteria bacterium]